MDDEDLTDEERAEQVRGVLFKALAVLAVIGVLIFIGTTIMVRALGLNETDTGPVGAAPEQPTKPLPTTALPSPKKTEKAEKPTEGPSEPAKPGKQGRIELAISPVLARPMERVNLTGTYKGMDNLQLEVQRFEDGQWRDFGVQATVRVGTFETYIMTGRTGENRFRMFDPESDAGSNVILVTID
jgi:hypothetical protein